MESGSLVVNLTHFVKRTLIIKGDSVDIEPKDGLGAGLKADLEAKLQELRASRSPIEAEIKWLEEFLLKAEKMQEKTQEESSHSEHDSNAPTS